MENHSCTMHMGTHAKTWDIILNFEEFSKWRGRETFGLMLPHCCPPPKLNAPESTNVDSKSAEIWQD